MTEEAKEQVIARMEEIGPAVGVVLNINMESYFDVLTGLAEIPVCVAYDVGGVRHDEMPMTQSDFHHAKPIYENLPGWSEDITKCRTFDELPANCQAYILRVEELIGSRISAIGVGPGRDEIIERYSFLG